MIKCKFVSKYFDYDKKKIIDFECDEESLKNDLCLFHDDNFSNQEERLDKLNKKVSSAISKKEPLFCIGFNIPKIKVTENFSSPVYFTKAKFQSADFSDSKFYEVDFSGSKFNDVNFSGSKFENADFMGVNFKNKANFSMTLFNEKVNFSESVFNEGDFSESFLKNAHFLGTKFKKVDFNLAKIEDCDFFGMVVEGKITLVGSKIKNSFFPNVKFGSQAIFTGANFEKTNMPNSKFKAVEFDHVKIKIGNFQGITIQGNANFASAQLEKVDFLGLNILKNSNFVEAILSEVSFTNALFQGPTNFSKTIFKDNVRFYKSEFQESNFSDSKFEGITFFDNVFFKNPTKVVFDVSDLSKVSFKNTELLKIRFTDKVNWSDKHAFIIQDEKMLSNSPQREELENVIASYRNLRKNYERRFRNEEAYGFFSREIALMKKYNMLVPIAEVSNLELLNSKLAELEKENEMLKEKIEELEDLKKNSDVAEKEIS